MIRYRLIKDFPGYRVGDDGSVWSCRKIGCKAGIMNEWRRLIPLKHPKGYLMVAPRKNGRNHTKPIHKLVLDAFVGPCPEGMECRHRNGDPADNRLSNLSWGTSKKNAQDKKKHGTHLVGEQCHTSRLTEEKVIEIRELHKTGEYSQSQLASLFGITQTPISLIVRRKTWRHI